MEISTHSRLRKSIMNPQGQVMIESAMVLFILVFMALAAVAILLQQRRQMKHERDVAVPSTAEPIRDDLQSLGLITFDSRITEENVETLESQDWVVDKKIHDPKGHFIFLMRRGDQGLLIN